jgi:hypothetical protein
MTQRAKQQNPRRREVAGSIPVFARKKKLSLFALRGTVYSRVTKKSRDEKLQQLSQMPA